MNNICEILCIPSLFIFLVSCNPSPESILLQYEKAHNAGDIEKELSFYHSDIEFELKGTWVKKGLEKMKVLAEWDAALNSNLDFTITDKRDDSLFCRVIEQNDWFKKIGIDELVHEPTTFVIQNQKIKHITAIPKKETGQQIYSAITKVYKWSALHQDSTVYGLMPNGEFIYSEEAAHQWMELLEKVD